MGRTESSMNAGSYRRRIFKTTPHPPALPIEKPHQSGECGHKHEKREDEDRRNREPPLSLDLCILVTEP